MSCGLTSLVLFPDAAFTAGGFVSATSQGGATEPSLIPDAGNIGSLAPIYIGTPIDGIPQDLSILSGGLPGQATFTIPGGLGTGTDEVGAHDVVHLNSWGSPIDSTEGTLFPVGSGMVLSEVARQLQIWAIEDTTGLIQSRYIDMDGEDLHNWQTGPEIDTATEGFPVPQDDSGALIGRMISVVETRRGHMLMAYSYLTSPFPDPRWGIALLRSADGGTTWRLVVPNLIPTGDTPFDPDKGFRMAASGRWIRIVWGSTSGGDIGSRSSSDEGASWGDVTTYSAILSLTTAAFEEHPWAFTGVGDSGQFIMPLANNPATSWTYLHAFGDSPFTEISNGTGAGLASRATKPGTGEGVRSMAACSAWGRTFVAVFTAGSTNNTEDQIQIYFQTNDRLLLNGPGFATGSEPTRWLPLETIAFTRGTHFYPQCLDMVSAWGQGLALHWGRIENTDLETMVAGSGMAWAGGLSPTPVGWQEIASGVNGYYQGHVGYSWATAGAYTLTRLAWSPVLENPLSGASKDADSEWVQSTAGTPSVTYNSGYLEIAAVSADTETAAFTEATGEGLWAQRGAVLTVSAKQVADGSTAGKVTGITLSCPLQTAGRAVSLNLIWSTTAIAVLDTSGTLATITADLTGWWTAHLAFHETAAGVVSCRLTLVRDDARFTILGDESFSASDTAATVDDSITWGHHSGGNSTTQWREITLTTGDSATSNKTSGTFLGGDVALGIPCLASTPLCVGNGLSVVWGGFSGSRGDQFAGTANYLHGVAQIFADDSTLIGWRSGGADPLVDQTLIFQAGANAWNVWEHTHVALFGLTDQTVTVEFATDEAFTVPLHTTTIDATVYDGTVMADPVGDMIEVKHGDRPWPNGGTMGLFVRFTSGTAIGVTFRVIQHTGTFLRLDRSGMNGDLASYGVANTDTFDVFAPYAYAEISKDTAGDLLGARFMRIVFADDDTATGDHRCTAIIPAYGLDFDLPIQWTNANQITANVAERRGNTSRSAYERGPALRTFTGRILNDYTQWREAFRALVDGLSGWGEKPIALVLDDENPVTMLRGVVDGASLDNSFVWSDTMGALTHRFPGGDLQLVFREV